jgi:hypothetical protein
MEENKQGQNTQQADVCACCSGKYGMYGHHHHGHFVLRLLLGLVILWLVFTIGLKIGEFRGYLESDYGYGHHRMFMPYGMGSGFGFGAVPGMPVPQNTPATPAK